MHDGSNELNRKVSNSPGPTPPALHSAGLTAPSIEWSLTIGSHGTTTSPTNRNIIANMRSPRPYLGVPRCPWQDRPGPVLRQEKFVRRDPMSPFGSAINLLVFFFLVHKPFLDLLSLLVFGHWGLRVYVALEFRVRGQMSCAAGSRRAT